MVMEGARPSAALARESGGAVHLVVLIEVLQDMEGDAPRRETRLDITTPGRDLGGFGRSTLSLSVAAQPCHDPRRRGEDIQVVQRLMGHSNIATTTRYLHLSDAELLAAIDRAFPEG